MSLLYVWPTSFNVYQTSIYARSTVSQCQAGFSSERRNPGTAEERGNTAEDAYVSKSRVGDQQSGFVIHPRPRPPRKPETEVEQVRSGSRRSVFLRSKFFLFSCSPASQPASTQRATTTHQTTNRQNSIEERVSASRSPDDRPPNRPAGTGLRPPDADPDRHRKRLTQQHHPITAGSPRAQPASRAILARTAAPWLNSTGVVRPTSRSISMS